MITTRLRRLTSARQSAIRFTSTFPIMHPLSTHTHAQILHNLCFSFLLVTTAVPREIENNAYVFFFGGGGGGGGYGALWEMWKWRIRHLFSCPL